MKILRNIRNKISRNEQGAALLTVMTVLTIVSILMLATISFVAQAHYQTTKNYYNRQAFYTARSGLETIVDYLSAPENQAMAIDFKNQIPSYGTGTLDSDPVEIPGLGTYTISVRYESGGTIVIESEAVYGSGDNETTQSLCAYLIKGEGGFEGLFDSAIKTSGNATLSNNANVLGDITAWTKNTNSNFVMDNSMKLLGALYNDGDVTTKTSGTEVNLTDGGFVINGNYTNLNPIHFYTANPINNDKTNKGDYIDVRGRITQTGGAMYVGYYTNNTKSGYVDVYCNELNVTNSMTINGDLYVYAGNGYEGNVSISNAATLTVYGNVYIEGQLKIESAAIKTYDADMTDAYSYGNIYVAGKGVAAMSGGAIVLTGANDSTIGGNINVYDKGVAMNFEKVTFTAATDAAGNAVKRYLNVAGDVVYTGNQKEYTNLVIRATGTISDRITADKSTVSNINHDRDFPDFTKTGTLRENVPTLKDRESVFAYVNEQLSEQIIDANAAAIISAKDVQINTDTKYANSEFELIDGKNFIIINESFNIGKLQGNKKSNILIKLDSTAVSDLFVYLPSGSASPQNILVENNSDKYMVYFIVGDPNYFEEATSGTKPYKISDDAKTINVGFDNAKIMHRATYEAYKGGKAINFSDLPDGTDYYTPEASTIYYVVMSDAKLNFSNQCTIEGALLAPNATVSYTNGNSFNVVKPDREEASITMFHIGSGIYGGVSAGNNTGFAYVKPKDSPFLGITDATIMGENMKVVYKKS